MKNRVPPRVMATKILKLMKPESPDYHYVKEIFRYIRQDLDLVGRRAKARPKLPMAPERLEQFFRTVWDSFNRTHIVMIKLLAFTGMKQQELANLKVPDVDLVNLQCRISPGESPPERLIPFPGHFREELADFVDLRKKTPNSPYLFETNRKGKLSTRLIRLIIREYSLTAQFQDAVTPSNLRRFLLVFLLNQGLSDAEVDYIAGIPIESSKGSSSEIDMDRLDRRYQEAMMDFPIQRRPPQPLRRKIGKNVV